MFSDPREFDLIYRDARGVYHRRPSCSWTPGCIKVNGHDSHWCWVRWIEPYDVNYEVPREPLTLAWEFPPRQPR